MTLYNHKQIFDLIVKKKKKQLNSGRFFSLLCLLVIWLLIELYMCGMFFSEEFLMAYNFIKCLGRLF